MASLIELKPNRLLLDSSFDGYKLSLREIPMEKRRFKNTVDRVLLNSNQYSLLHAKLFGLHNHLVGDEFAKNGSVYFIDQDWNINKIFVDSLCNELSDPITVWQVPKLRERISGDYNVSLKFVSPTTVVVCDGTGFLYILHTGCRDNAEKFRLSFSEEVAGPNEPFVLVDAVFNQQKTNPELHVLLLSIKQENLNEPYVSFLHWITLRFEKEIWSQTALKQLKTKGVIQYAAIEKSCEAVYIASDNESKIILNSDNPVLTINQQNAEELKYLYEWSQTIENISIHINLPDNPCKQLVHVFTEPTKIDIKYDNTNLVSGLMYQRVNPDVTTWSIEQNKLVVSLNKQEVGLIWPELIVGDNTGKLILDSCIVEQVNEKLAHLTSEQEEMTQTGTTFNSQQVEECDFENDKITTFERISGISNKMTHKINLGSHQILMTAQLHRDLPPAIGIRYDVDICLWQPDGANDNFSVSHEGTLLALGYVQASKQNRKFLVCPPNMEYSAICESSGHIFIYRQKRPISSSELRHRTTGRRIQNIAEQQVLNITNDEILGIQAFNNQLFLLCENYLMYLKL